MPIRLLTSSTDLERYDTWIKSHPQGTLWQSVEWKTFQEALGREVRIYIAEDDGQITASALVMIDITAFGLSTWDIARGPLGDGKLLEKIVADAKVAGCMSLYFSPMRQLTFRPSPSPNPSPRHIHPHATRILDLTLDDDAQLAQMKPKGRYNIRLAQKHGVRVERSDDVRAYAAIAGQTAARDRFRGNSSAHYHTMLQSLPGSFLLLGYAPQDQREPIAGLIGVAWAGKGIYYYGASSDAARHLMAPYALQWEAMKHCKAAGCTTYDLFGIAPTDAPADHPWQGITSFKEKFGGTYIEYPPEQEIVLRPMAKTALSLKRKLIG